MINKEKTFLQCRELIINHVYFEFKIGETPDGGLYSESPETEIDRCDHGILFLMFGIPPMWITALTTPGQRVIAFLQAVGNMRIHLCLFREYVLSTKGCWALLALQEYSEEWGEDPCSQGIHSATNLHTTLISQGG